jgi:hypothetical protein
MAEERLKWYRQVERGNKFIIVVKDMKITINKAEEDRS